jgi:hypothetical protein
MAVTNIFVGNISTSIVVISDLGASLAPQKFVNLSAFNSLYDIMRSSDLTTELSLGSVEMQVGGTDWDNGTAVVTSIPEIVSNLTADEQAILGL